MGIFKNIFRPAAQGAGAVGAVGAGAYFGLPAVFNSAVEGISEKMGIDPNILKAAAPAAIGGVLGSFVGQGTLGMALGVGLTVLNAVNNPESPAAQMAAKFTGPTPDVV